MEARATAANASLNSKTSTSFTDRPARSRALAVERDGWVIRQVSGPATIP